MDLPRVDADNGSCDCEWNLVQYPEIDTDRVDQLLWSWEGWKRPTVFLMPVVIGERELATLASENLIVSFDKPRQGCEPGPWETSKGAEV